VYLLHSRHLVEAIQGEKELLDVVHQVGDGEVYYVVLGGGLQGIYGEVQLPRDGIEDVHEEVETIHRLYGKCHGVGDIIVAFKIGIYVDDGIPLFGS
jgi:hypothetical protein